MQEHENGTVTVYEASYGENESVCTQEQSDKLIQNQREALGIPNEWISGRELDWLLLENAAYKNFVQEIDLKENRKKRQAESNSVLKDKWIVCGQNNALSFKLANESDKISFYWRGAIEYILADYCKKNDVPEKEWTLLKIVSYGDGIFAAILCCENDESQRELCLLIDSDAILPDLEKFTEYIVAIDFMPDQKGMFSWHSSYSYDSMLEWISYKELARWNAECPYIIHGSEANLYMNDSDGEPAMNQYLKSRHADTKMEWTLDTNAICFVGSMQVLRYTCKEQEIVMALDKYNKTFAIIKGLDGE